MNTYEEMYKVLLKLCEKEGLRLVETEMSDKNFIATFREDCVILNTIYSKKEGSNGLNDFYRLISDAVCNE